jgi:hypothetical protein
MRATVVPTTWFDSVNWQTAILIFTSGAMSAALIAKFALHQSSAADTLLLV